MPTLFSYCVRYDGGSAPNPFGGICTLVIWKPAIRRVALVGDWIVGTGSKTSSVGDTAGRMIYAMRVSEKLTMAEYDERCMKRLTAKIPDPLSPRRQDHVGDAIWHYRSPNEPPTPRPGDHDETNRKTDLGGKYALLSDQFFYFGKTAPMLPDHLLGLVKQGPGHRAEANAHLLKPFLAWIEKQPEVYKASRRSGMQPWGSPGGGHAFDAAKKIQRKLAAGYGAAAREISSRGQYPTATDGQANGRGIA